MKPEDLNLSIGFSSHSNSDGRVVSVSINWKYQPLIKLRLELKEFALAMSTLQGRPAIEFDVDHQYLRFFLEALNERKITKVNIRNSSTKKETLVSITAYSDLGTVACHKIVSQITADGVRNLKLLYPDAEILIPEPWIVK